MTKEENKAIEDLKDILKYWQTIVEIEDDVEREIEMNCYSEEMPFKQLKIALNLIEKTTKENEELRVQGSIILLDYNILKDKIKEIIKEELPDDDICKSCGRYDVNGVVIKQKLIKVLEEE